MIAHLINYLINISRLELLVGLSWYLKNFTIIIFFFEMKLALSMRLLIKKGKIFRIAMGIFKNGAH